MTPEIVVPPSPEAAAAAEALEDTAVSLDTIAEAIDAEAEVSRERADELLGEVRQCREQINQISQSLAQQTTAESPSIQQILIQLGTLQTSVEKLQAEVEALGQPSQNSEELGARNGGVKVENPAENTPPSPNIQNPPESNQSGTPAQPPPIKKRYVKV